jgi:hypothetical protein
MLELLQAEESRATDRRGEGGQITILVVFGGLAFVLLAAFIFNTAKQTSRKIQMQGAADAAAVATGVWMARGMNLTALNNNTMVEMLSIMISVRSVLQTLQIEHNILSYVQFIPYVGAVARFELAFVRVEMRFWAFVDRSLNRRGGVGWQVLTGLDKLNQVVKNSFPEIALLQALHYANVNGADQPPFGLLFPGKSSGLGLSIYPLARGPRTLLVTEAQECALRGGGPLRTMAYFATVRGPLTGLLSFMYLQDMFDRNIDSLMGRRVGPPLRAGGIGTIVDYILGEILHIKLPIGTVLNFASSIVLFNPPVEQPLRWEADTRPMILSDTPERGTTNITSPGLLRVREFLKYLAFALGKTHAGSPIGGERYPNPDWPFRVTYAQADVYNPTRWDMFTQDWRAKLVRARLLDVKCREVGQKIGFGNLCGQGWGLVNTH